MPITFAPASPFNARAAASLADQRDRIDAQRQMQQSQAYTQASIASAGNLTRAAETDAELDARRIQQQFQMDFARQAQQREFEAARQQQMRAQQFEMAKMNVAITKQEQDEQTRRINGLATIQRQKAEGILTDEQAGDAEMELLTGINAFQRRSQYQQSKALEQQAQMRQREVADYQKTAAMSEKFMVDMAMKGITVQAFTNPETGRTSFLAYDQKTGRLYNPLLEHAGKGGEEKPGGEWGHLSTEGRFDEAKALKDAKAYAEGQLPVLKGADGKDSNAAARADLITRRVDGMRSEFKQAPVEAPQAEPTPQQAAQPPSPRRGMAVLNEVKARDAADTVEAIRSEMKVSPEKQPELDRLLTDLRRIMASPDFLSPKNPALRAEYEAVTKALKNLKG